MGKYETGVVDGCKLALSVQEVAERVGVCPPLIYSEIREGRLKALRVGKRLIIPLTAVNDWLEVGTA